MKIEHELPGNERRSIKSSSFHVDLLMIALDLNQCRCQPGPSAKTTISQRSDYLLRDPHTVNVYLSFQVSISVDIGHNSAKSLLESVWLLCVLKIARV